MKKWMFVLCLAVFVSGCSGNPDETNNNETTNNQDENQENEHISMLENMDLGAEITKQNENFHIEIALENRSNLEIPLNYSENQLFDIVVTQGDVVETFVVEEKNRKKLNPGEKITYLRSIEDTFKAGEIAFEIRLNATDQDETLSKTISYTKESFHAYLPKEKVTYVYKDMVQDQEMIETFDYFEDGYAQSNHTVSGVNVYAADQEGLYLVYSDYDNKNIDKNIIGAVEEDRKMLLKLPANTGDTWTVDDISYETVSVDQTIETEAGTFENVVEVKMDSGLGVHLFYHRDFGLIQVKVNTGDGFAVPTVLEKILYDE